MQEPEGARSINRFSPTAGKSSGFCRASASHSVAEFIFDMHGRLMDPSLDHRIDISRIMAQEGVAPATPAKSFDLSTAPTGRRESACFELVWQDSLRWNIEHSLLGSVRKS